MHSTADQLLLMAIIALVLLTGTRGFKELGSELQGAPRAAAELAPASAEPVAQRRRFASIYLLGRAVVRGRKVALGRARQSPRPPAAPCEEARNGFRRVGARAVGHFSFLVWPSIRGSCRCARSSARAETIELHVVSTVVRHRQRGGHSHVRASGVATSEGTLYST